MNTEIIPFEFGSSEASIRVVEIDGEPWFVAKDVAEALEYTWKGTSGTLAHIPEEWKGCHPVQTPSGTQEMVILSEHGVYFLVLRSDKPKALPFQKWLAGEVLPSLRQRGYYGELKPSEVLRYHTVMTRTIKQLETTKSALSQNLLLQQVRAICSTLHIRMPKVTLHQKAAQVDVEEGKGGHPIHTPIIAEESIG